MTDNVIKFFAPVNEATIQKLVAHDFGSIDSIGLPMYCSGAVRLCVPQARFLLHPVTMNFSAGAVFDLFPAGSDVVSVAP